jgi:hypothetical protein
MTGKELEETKWLNELHLPERNEEINEKPSVRIAGEGPRPDWSTFAVKVKNITFRPICCAVYFRKRDICAQYFTLYEVLCCVTYSCYSAWGN